MSPEDDERAAGQGSPNPICEYCGFEIEEEGQECPALDDGECQP